MNTYLVFFGRRGTRSIVWEAHENPLGVYEGNTPEEAMQAAAAHVGVMGAFFAVSGAFWGVTPGNVPKPFGSIEAQEVTIAKLLEKITDRLAIEAPATETDAVVDE